jgi:hypothetical protein
MNNFDSHVERIFLRETRDGNHFHEVFTVADGHPDPAKLPEREFHRNSAPASNGNRSELTVGEALSIFEQRFGIFNKGMWRVRPDEPLS